MTMNLTNTARVRVAHRIKSNSKFGTKFGTMQFGIIACLAVLVAACGTKDAADPLSPSGAQGRVRFVNVITDTTKGRVNAILEKLPFGVNLTYTQSTPASLPDRKSTRLNSSHG